MVDSRFSVLVKVFKHFRNSSILRHIQAYSGVNGHIQECFWYFHNPLLGIFRTMVYSELGTYSKLCQISAMECYAKLVKGCNCFRNINFSRFLRYEINIMNFLNIGLIFTPEVSILCKKVWGSGGLRAVDFDIPFTTTAFH